MDTKKQVILITGATGHQGGAVAHELLAKGYTVRAMTRKPDSPAAKRLAELGAEIVQGDLNDAKSLERPLTGVWGTFAVQNTWEAGVEGEEEQGKRFAEVAKARGVQHYVYTSVASADRKTGIPHFENKFRVEEKVRSLRFPSHVIIRPVFFMENLTGPWFLSAIQQGQLAIGIEPTTKLQQIAVRDIGRYGAWAFERHAELNGREIDIAGDELTMPETAAVLGKAMGRTLTHLQVPIEEVRKVSADFASMLEWFDRVGYDADIAATSKESGIRPTSLAEWAPTADWAPVPAR
jgi:uncharacterized protein YbjT (DUF2867 family)